MNKLISVKQNEKKMDLFDENDNYCESIEDSLSIGQYKPNNKPNNIISDKTALENNDKNNKKKRRKKKIQNMLIF